MGLVLPRCTTEGMSLHLAEVSQAVAPGAHAARPGGPGGLASKSKRLVVPDNITLRTAPGQGARVEPRREHLAVHAREFNIKPRSSPLTATFFDHCCDAWNKLTDRPWLIMSIGLRNSGSPVLINGTW